MAWRHNGHQTHDQDLYRVCQKRPNLFLTEPCQISTKFDNFWHTDSQDDGNMRGTLIVHCIQFMSMHYRVKRRCSKLLHYVVINSTRLLTFLLSIRQMVPRDLIILWY